MPKIDITAFRGEAPRITPRQLDTSQAQTATNCSLDRGHLAAMSAPADLFDLTGSGLRTIFKLNSDMWLVFNEVANVCRWPIDDQDDRFLWTDGVRARWSDYTKASNDGALTYGEPNSSYYLGVPAPAVGDEIVATVTGAAANADPVDTVSYVYTWVTTEGFESAPSDPSNTVDVYEGQYVRLTGFETPIPSTYDIVGYRIYRLNTGTTSATYQLVTELYSAGKDYTAFGDILPNPGYIDDKTAGSQTAGTGTISSSGLDITGSGTAFSTEVAAGDYIVADGQVREVDTVSDDTNLTLFRAFSPDISGKTFTFGTADSTTLATLLEESVPTTVWTEPPSSLAGLIALSNGVFVCFEGKDIYLSEPFIPYAFPDDYKHTADFDVVALGYFGTTVVIGTEANPFLVDGIDPQSAMLTRVPAEQACLFERGMVSGATFVIYPSPDGLFMISADGYEILTKGLFTKSQWMDLLSSNTSAPATTYDKTIIAFLYDNKYYAFFQGTNTGFIIDFDNTAFQHYIPFTLATGLQVWGGYVDALSDTLDLLVYDGSAWNIRSWEGSVTKLSYTWKSKRFSFMVDLSFSCARLQGDFTSGVTLKLYTGGTLILTHTVTDNNPFRLPTDRGREWEVQIEGDETVHRITLATSMQELML